MPPPNDAPAFSTEILLIESGQKNLRVSNPLADLLSEAREQYVWGAKSASESQEIIVRLESETARRLADIHDDSAQWVIQEVSRWGGNNLTAIRTIASASPEQKRRFADMIGWLLTSGSTEHALRELTKQPGLGLVMASKIYRSAVRISAQPLTGIPHTFSTPYLCVRERNAESLYWIRQGVANGKHKASRLAIYTDPKRDANLKEYYTTYLPSLKPSRMP